MVHTEENVVSYYIVLEGIGHSVPVFILHYNDRRIGSYSSKAEAEKVANNLDKAKRIVMLFPEQSGNLQWFVDRLNNGEDVQSIVDELLEWYDTPYNPMQHQ